MILRGRAHRFGDDVNTDYVIASRYKAKTASIAEMARHIMEDLDPSFASRIKPGDFIVAGRNFGCGSSREAAPRVIREVGIAAVIAESFARIFYRNSINIGLPILACATGFIDQDDEIEVDLAVGGVRDLTKGQAVRANPLPKVMLNVVADGGLAAHLRKHGTFVLD